MKFMIKKIKSSLEKHKWQMYLLVAVIYLLIAFIRFDNIAQHITSIVPGADADTFGNLWDIWWVPYSLFKLHASMFSTNLLFWPLGANLVYQTLTPLAALLTAPLQSISLPLAYNTLFFLGFALSGVGMFVLGDYVLSNKYAAFIAGIIYTFSATHIIYSYTYLDWMFWGWIPLGLYFFLKILNEPKNYYNVLGLGISFVLSLFMANLEQGVLEIIMYFFVFVAFMIYRDTLKKVLRKEVFLQLALALIIIFILGSWSIVPIINSLIAKPAPGIINSNLIAVANQLNSIQYNIRDSMDLLSFFLPSFYHGGGTTAPLFSYYWFVFSLASIEKTGYLTYTAIILAIIGIIKNRKSKSNRLWIVLGLIFFWLSTGPYLLVFGGLTNIPGPYLIYHLLPVINIIREPGRFIVIGIMALSILAGFGYIEIEKFIKKMELDRPIDIKYMAVVAIVFLFMIENLGTPITNSSGIVPLTTNPTISSFYYSLKNLSGNFSIMQLPAIPGAVGQQNIYSAEVEYFATASQKPILGGYITRTNYTELNYLYNVPLAIESRNLQTYGALAYVSPVNENYTNQTLLVLYNFNTAFVVINAQAYNSSDVSTLYNFTSSVFGKPVYQNNYTVAFETVNAIDKSLFHSYVAYPVLSDWSYQPIALTDNLSSNTWSPITDGLLALYAPYPNNVNASKISPYGSQYMVNATMTFYTVSVNHDNTQLEIGEQTGTNNPTSIVTVNVTSTPVSYTIRLSHLVSGELGNYVLFVPSGGKLPNTNSSDVLVYNITISKTS